MSAKTANKTEGQTESQSVSLAEQLAADLARAFTVSPTGDLMVNGDDRPALAALIQIQRNEIEGLRRELTLARAQTQYLLDRAHQFQVK